MTRITGTTSANTLRGSAFGDDIDGRDGNDRLYGLDGHDDLDGGRGSDQLYGDAGNDDLDGGAGNDRLDGGTGDDKIEGGRGNDILTGGAGADRFEFERGDGRDIITDFVNGEDRIELDDFNAATIQSMIGQARQVGSDVVLTLSADSSITLQNFRLSDLDLSDFAGVSLPQPSTPVQPERGRDINGTNAANTLVGGSGNDDIEGRGGNDQLQGGAGDDDIDGGRGKDSLWGGDGRDELDGGSGNDRLDGGTGDDKIEGGRGNDILTGGAGADRFEFERGDGRDIITDFVNGEDRIELDDFSYAQAMAVINRAQQVGDDVVLALSADTTISISNMQLAQLDISDFIL